MNLTDIIFVESNKKRFIDTRSYKDKNDYTVENDEVEDVSVKVDCNEDGIE